MVKYLQMDGVDDKLKAPSVPFKEIILDMIAEPINNKWQYYIDARTGVTSYLAQNSSNTVSFTGANVYVDGVQIVANMASIPLNQRILLRHVVNTAGTDDVNIFSNQNGLEFMKGKIFSVKFLDSGGNIQANYDMSTGTVQDQSGNGRHATLTGGTWLDDGTGGTPTGTDGSFSVDTRQYMYQDGSTSSDMNQVLYQISSTSFDMLQEIFNDGQVGQTPFDMQFQLYADGSILHDSRQTMYESGQNAFDLKQAIYESGEGKADIRLILFSDSSTHHDLIQSLYEDAAVHFDTKQISFNPDQQKIGTIRLKGKRDLYVYLVAKQSLYVPLKAKRELTVPLKGGVNMTMQNQNFSMIAGDTKYIIFPIEGADDLTGATITWGARQRSYSSVEKLLTKSTGNGITVEGAEVKIKLDPADTELLNGTYHHECQLEDNLQNVSTVFTGLMTVNKSAV